MCRTPAMPPWGRDQPGLRGKDSTKMARRSNEGRGGVDGHLPSASQSNHFSQPPFLLSRCSADWLCNARRDPGKAALGSGIKLPYECGRPPLNSESFSGIFINGRLQSPANNRRGLFVPAQRANLRGSQDEMAPLRRCQFKPPCRKDPGEVPVGHNEYVVQS